MNVIKEDGKVPIKIWTNAVEDSAMQQLKNLAGLPFIPRNGIAVMPDVHWGNGTSVGTVLATHRAIVPAAVGVDIGCGMNAVRTNLRASDLPDSLSNLRHSIERGVPLGAGGNHQHHAPHFPSELAVKWEAFVNLLGENSLDHSFLLNKAVSQLGTLGSGNHFIEICLDEEQRVWVMLHSGSRGVGNILGRRFMDVAKAEMEKWHIKLADANLAYLPEGTECFNQYIAAMLWCQDYALQNRKAMMRETLKNLEHEVNKGILIASEAINCHHNYAERENHFGDNLWVTRKGAVRARLGDLGIIPGSMGQRSYIVRGLGNAESYCSCSHGAGRAMSRTEARKRFTVEDLQAQTAGVECRKDDAVLDEIPSSYKDIDQVIAAQADLIEIVHTLKQVLCVKGA